MNFTLHIRRNVLDHLFEQSVKSNPRECCAALLGTHSIQNELVCIEGYKKLINRAISPDQFLIAKNDIPINMHALFHSHVKSQGFSCQDKLSSKKSGWIWVLAYPQKSLNEVRMWEQNLVKWNVISMYKGKNIVTKII